MWMSARFGKKPKQSPPAERMLLDAQQIVLRFFVAETAGHGSGDLARAPVLAEEPGPEICHEVLAHVGFVNRNTWHFAACRLRPNVEELLAPAVLAALPAGIFQACVKSVQQAGASLGIYSDMELFSQEEFDLALSWRVQILCVSQEEDRWQHYDSSSTVLPLVHLPGDDAFRLWSGWAVEKEQLAKARKSQKRKGSQQGSVPGQRAAVARAGGSVPGPKPKRSRTRAPPAAQLLADADEEVELPAGDLEGVQGIDNSGVGGVYDNMFEEEQDGEEEEEDGGLAFIEEEDGLSSQLPAGVQNEGGGAKDSDSAASEDPLAPNECEENFLAENLAQEIEAQIDLPQPAVPAVAAEEAELMANMLGVDEAAVAAAAAVEGAADRPGHARVAAAGAADVPRLRRADFYKLEFNFAPYGRVGYYSRTKLLIAVCGDPRHGDCRLTRVCAKHPRAKSLSTSIGGQGRPLGQITAWLKAHGDYVSQQQRVHYCRPDRAARVEARAEFLQLEGAADFAEMAERPQEAGEESEPMRIS